MPQFDKVTFFGQLFWFTIIFSILFFYISYHFVPQLALYSKIQQKILKYNTKSFNHVTLINNLMSKCGSYYNSITESRLKINNFFFKSNSIDSETLWQNFNKEQKAIYLANLKLNIRNNIANNLLK